MFEQYGVPAPTPPSSAAIASAHLIKPLDPYRYLTIVLAPSGWTSRVKSFKVQDFPSDYPFRMEVQDNFVLYAEFHGTGDISDTFGRPGDVALVQAPQFKILIKYTTHWVRWDRRRSKLPQHPLCRAEFSLGPARNNPSWQYIKDADNLSLVNGREGTEVPNRTEKITWGNGLESYVPFLRPQRGESEDLKAVRIMAAAPDALSLPEDERPVFVLKIAEYCVDPLRPTLDEHQRVKDTIRHQLSKNMLVLIRGHDVVGVQVHFKKEEALDQTIVCQDSKFMLDVDDLDDQSEIHREMELREFIDLADDPNCCLNIPESSSRDMSSMPWFIKGICDARTALYCNRHDSYATTARDPKQRKVELTGLLPLFIHPDADQMAMWDVWTHATFLSQIHHAVAGFCTWMTPRDGCKFLTIIKLNPDLIKSRKDLIKAFYEATGALTNDEDRKWVKQTSTIYLMPGDVLIQGPGTMYSVFTPVKTIANGGYFYLYETMHLTEVSCAVDHHHANVMTDQERPAAFRLFMHMTIALPCHHHRSFLLYPFLALARMILETEDDEVQLNCLEPAHYDDDDYVVREVLGELQEAREIIRAVLVANEIEEKDVPRLIERSGADWAEPGTAKVDLSCLSTWRSVVCEPISDDDTDSVVSA